MARPAEAVKSPAEAAYALNCLCRHRKLGERALGSVCTWTCSSVGRATRLHRVGRRFEYGRVHHKLPPPRPVADAVGEVPQARLANRWHWSAWVPKCWGRCCPRTMT